MSTPAQKEPNKALTREQLCAIFEINPETGVIRRIDGKPEIVPHQGGYLRWSIFGERYLAHRLMWLYVHGEFPDCYIDHINRDTSDNRISNLRLASRSENKQNQRTYKNNTSGHRGVRFKPDQGKWQAVIGHEGKRFSLGSFLHFDDAVAAYRSASLRLHKYGVFQ